MRAKTNVSSDGESASSLLRSCSLSVSMDIVGPMVGARPGGCGKEREVHGRTPEKFWMGSVGSVRTNLTRTALCIMVGRQEIRSKK